MIMGLRLTGEGVSAETFRQRFGVSLEDRFGNEIRRLQGWGLLEGVIPTAARESSRDPVADAALDRIRLTPRGRLLGNRVFSQFV